MRAVICGAGIAGLALAQRLSTLGWEVVVVEKSPGPRRQGYMIDFFGPGYDAAEAMGVLPRLRELGYHIDELSYLDESGRRRARLSYKRFSSVVNDRLLSIMRPDLEVALREQVTDRAEIRFGCSVARIENPVGGVRVVLSDGSTLEADLLVGADGIHSDVRRMVFGDEAQFLRYLGFHTAAYFVDDPQIHAQVNNRFCLTDTTGRQMGFYGLRGGRVAVFAVHRSPDPSLPEDARGAVRKVYSTLGWLAPDALAQCPEPSEVYYDQVAQIEMPEWSRGRVTLVGDACQAVSLLAGQGASLAIAGAFVLADRLASADTVESALAEYQRLWQPRVVETQRAGRRGAEWFLPVSRHRLWLRRVVLRLMNLPGFDRFFGTALVGKSNVTLESLTGSVQHHMRPASKV